MKPISSLISGNKSSNKNSDKQNNFLLKQLEWDNERIGEIEGEFCHKCKNKGFVAVLDGDYPAIDFCECMIARENATNLKKSGLSQKCIDKYSFDSYEIGTEWQKQVKTKAIEFAKTPNQNMFYVGGQSGSGKTHICTAILKYFMENSKRGKYMMWLDDSNKIKSLSLNGYEQNILIDSFKDVQVLYIDDFFKSENGKSPSTADIKLAYQIINARYMNSESITIISSELTLKEIKNIDESIASRIYELAKKGCVLEIEKGSVNNYRLKD